MKNVVGYIRVSTDHQTGDDAYGLEVQEAVIREYCHDHDMCLVHIYRDEGLSGAKERPGFDSIVYGPDVTNPPFEAVIVAKSDRVARDIMIYYSYKHMLRKKGVELISIAEDFGQYGQFANMLESFTLCIAEMERKTIADRTTAGRKAKAAAGGYAGGRAPFGYHISGRELQVDADEAGVVLEVFRLRETGLGARGITRQLVKAGVTGRKGNPIAVSTVQSILDNELVYRGNYRYGDADWRKGQHEAILKD